MRGASVPAIVLLVEALVFLAVGVREAVTRSWLGFLVASGLGFVAFLSAWTLEIRRRSLDK